MNSRSYLQSAFVLGLAFVGAATPLGAQTSDASRLPKLLKTGDTIVITNSTGAETRGQVAAIGDTSVDIHAITPGAAPNEYIIGRTVTRVSIDQIFALYRANALGGARETLYYQRDSFGRLAARLKPGQVIRVFETSGAETIGKITELSPSALVVAARTAATPDGSGRGRYEWNAPRSYSPTLVEKIERPAPIWDGAVKGAVVAALVTTLVVVNSGCAGCTGVGPAYMATTAIGAGIGLGIDALFGPARVYQRRK